MTLNSFQSEPAISAGMDAERLLARQHGSPLPVGTHAHSTLVARPDTAERPAVRRLRVPVMPRFSLKAVLVGVLADFALSLGLGVLVLFAWGRMVHVRRP